MDQTRALEAVRRDIEDSVQAEVRNTVRVDHFLIFHFMQAGLWRLC